MALSSGKVTLSVAVTSAVVRDLSTVSDPLAFSIVKTLTNGTGANQATKVWSDTRSLGDGATENIDLYDFGGEPSAVGELFTNSRVVALVFQNKSATIGFTVGDEGSGAEWDALGNSVVVPPGGFLVMYNPTGYSVADATDHLLKILNNGGASANYDIIVVCS
jgi:hypothetical protein